jgi:hypothetical protein
VLGRERVGAYDNFFDLGGHSLLVVEAQRRVREELGREVSVIEMFQFPTVSALARRLRVGAGGSAEQVGRGRGRAKIRRSMMRRWQTV